MLTAQQLAENAFSAVDKNLYEMIFYRTNDIGQVEVFSGLVIGALIVAIIGLFMYFDKDNGYTPGHHSRANGNVMLAGIIVFVPYYFLKPSSESIAHTEKSLQERMIAKVPEVVAQEIKEETNLVTKLQIIIDEVDSSGRLYYSTGDDNKNIDTNSKKYGNMIHHYIDTHNYQAEYISGLKVVEQNYKVSKDISTAKFLGRVFENGNIFVEKNKAKADKYQKDVKTLKEEEMQHEKEASQKADHMQKEIDNKVPTVVPVKIEN